MIGSGAANDPYLVNDAIDLQTMNDDLSAYYELTRDIDASETLTWNEGSGFIPIGNNIGSLTKFVGHFDGKGYKIRHLYINRTDVTCVGLFGYVGDDYGTTPEIKNVGLINVLIYGKNDAGALVGSISYGSINGCYSAGNVEGADDSPGGVSGGLIGRANWGGGGSTLIIENCYSLCNVRHSGGANGNCGGLIGWAAVYGGVANCYAKGAITGGYYKGGLAGYVSSGDWVDCFWDTETSGCSIGSGHGIEVGIGKTTAQMKQQVTFINWDFTTFWSIEEDIAYPALRSIMSGSGTQSDPYIIVNVFQLQSMLHALDAYYELANNIDASETSGWNDGDGFKPIGDYFNNFVGSLNGRGRIISNLFIKREFTVVGLFGYIEGSSIQKVGLENVNITGGLGTGALVGVCGYSLVSQCYATGAITYHADWNGYVAGFIGGNTGSNIQNCYSHVNITKSYQKGGGAGFCGWFAGSGINHATIENCYATGKVNVNDEAYNYGFGYHDTGISTSWADCFWDKESSGLDIDGILPVEQGKITAEMKYQSIFDNWDFDTVWYIDEGSSYPRLLAFIIPSIEKVTLGTGELYLNNVNVGYLKGDVEFFYKRDKLDFKPAGLMAPVKQYVIKEEGHLKASLAELSMKNIRLAMGMTAAVGESQSYPAYDPSSYTPPAGASYDVVTFGGSKTVEEMSLRFEHTKPDGKKIIVVLYRVSSSKELTLPFHEEDFNLHDLVFDALAVDTRTAGDQMGFVVEQILGFTA